jgi:hypothetical protein
MFEPGRDISTAILGTRIETKDLEGTKRDVPEVNQRFNFCLGRPILPFPRPGKQQLMWQSRQLKLLLRQIEILRRHLFEHIISPVIMSLSLPAHTDHPTARAKTTHMYLIWPNLLAHPNIRNTSIHLQSSLNLISKSKKLFLRSHKSKAYSDVVGSSA